MDEWNAEIDKLEAKGNQAAGDAKLAYQKQIEELKAKRSKAEQKTSELRQASGDAWEDLKDGVEEAWNSLGEAVKSAAGRIQ
jgi:FtsZ-binding cell division protein ZapB